MKSLALFAIFLSFSAAAALPPLRPFKRGDKDDDAGQKDDAPAKDDKSKKDERPRREDKRKKEETPPAGAYEIEEFKNISYRDDKDADPVKHKLDLYLPKGQKDFPVLFFVHGGGWHSGNKELYTAIGQVFARNGIGAVVINYRLTPKVQFPGHMEDVAKAFAWTHANIARYGGRADRIICCGHSAGGHLVALLATDEKYLKAEKCSFKDIRCVVPISGVYALDEIHGLYQSVFGRDRAERKDASPMFHVTKGHPPFFILFADRDLPTIDKVSDEFYETLKNAKVNVREQMIPQRSHYSIISSISKDDDSTTVAIFDFIERHTEWKRPAAAMH